jgi:hypothetical protein
MQQVRHNGQSSTAIWHGPALHRAGRNAAVGRHVGVEQSLTGRRRILLTNLGRGTVEVAGWLVQAASMPQDAPLPYSFPLHTESMPSAIADQLRFEIIKDNSIGNGLDSFRASFNTVYAVLACG